MPKIVSQLKDIEIRRAKPKDKDYKLFDGEGLFILVKTNGSKLWRLKYRTPITKKEKLLSFGKYPYITLKKARELKDSSKTLLANGIDPSEKKKEDEKRQLEELEAKKREKLSQIHLVLNEWVTTLDNQESTIKRRIRNFEANLFPYIKVIRDEHGEITSSPQMKDIEHPDIMRAIDIKKKTANETARRLLTDCKALWNYAIAYGYATHNIINIIPKSQRPKKQVNHYAKITDPAILGELLNDIENYKGHPIIKFALMLAPHLMLRAENLTTLKWKYIDLKKKILTIPRSEMKIKDKNLPDFKLPLTDTAIKILEEVQLFTGWNKWVFHGIRRTNESVSPDAIIKALRVSLGYNNAEKGKKQTIHSFRGTFRSLVDTHDKKHQATFEVKERALDHHEKSGVVRAYAHKADYTKDIRTLLEWWEKFLGNLKLQNRRSR